MSRHFIETSSEYQAIAQARRNRGLHTGSVAAGHDWKPKTETDLHEIAAQSCLIGLRNTVAIMREPAFNPDDMPF